MKKVTIMSDNHGNYRHIQQIYDHEKADFYIHCGDNEGNDEDLQNFSAVTGNNDYWSDLPSFVKLKVEDMWIGIIHSNQFGYWDRERIMLEFMEERELDILCIGHTHMPMFLEDEENKKYIINPGSTALPRGGYPASYCNMYIDGKKVEVEFKLMEDLEEVGNQIKLGFAK